MPGVAFGKQEVNKLIRMEDLDLENQKVLIREDLNVPLADGTVSSTARIEAAIPTIRKALEKGAKVMLLSHLGRPQEGSGDQPQFSLKPVADSLAEFLGFEVPLITDYLQGFDWPAISPESRVVLLENVRFNLGEKINSAELAGKLADLCDVFVMDAFGTAHRAQASTEGVIRLAPRACAGPLLVKELAALGKALKSPVRPLVAVVGGSKVSTKLKVLESLAAMTDEMIVGGGIANTFLAASGFDVGASLFESELIETASRILDKTHVPLPTDVVVAKELPGSSTSKSSEAVVKRVSELNPDDMILDIGPETAQMMSELLQNAGTIIWNGPVGVFEHPSFAQGTRKLAEGIAASKGFSIAGGGDTLAAIDQFGVKDRISYISTGGGAFLEFVEGKTLPAVAALESRCSG